MRRKLKSWSRPITSSAVSMSLANAWREPSLARRTRQDMGSRRAVIRPLASASTQSPTVSCCSRRWSRARTENSAWPSCAMALLRWSWVRRARRVPGACWPREGSWLAMAWTRPMRRSDAKSIVVMMRMWSRIRGSARAQTWPARANVQAIENRGRRAISASTNRLGQGGLAMPILRACGWNGSGSRREGNDSRTHRFISCGSSGGWGKDRMHHRRASSNLAPWV